MALTVSDEMLGAVIPVIVYWLYSGIFVILGNKLDKYRLHSKTEDAQNVVSKWTVIKAVLFQHAIQISFTMVLLNLRKDGNDDIPKPTPPLYIIAVQFLVGIFVVDTVQYFTHRYVHENKFLYKHIHSMHHELVVPYSYGAFYTHPVEGLIVDNIGSGVAFFATGMTPRVGIVFFSFVIIKAIDVHTGIRWPYNIFDYLFWNTSAYHHVHHQLYGIKFNYAQPFFVSWDKIFGTYMPYSLEKRKDGGYTVHPVKDD